ncbi:geranylgeranylglyceryl/heptaprenylglyceryl phosphate synthase [Echinicola jeungdonensis]|uniref:Geranylgeranylglyceryl phosphate synthase n=1 Tax=Echinicola jeungdonensis TaxID=709343 RepID=A0ABV5J226_9BACT|nr:geranylgeranylglyceryl/heptaprenylglyceryl phosphate synthase [Echinicola jeungdonensis]MDN3669018.1 geranylgeranylglyceryl/heptaprenylglyceryl phosphate synthase [Echinicola jeungdonensis]
MVNNTKGIAQRLQHLRQTGKKGLALLIDPEKSQNLDKLKNITNIAQSGGADFVFVGGSQVTEKNIDLTIETIKNECKEIPVLLFPGHVNQVSKAADGILFISLISGRNPEFLIGQHVAAAPLLAKSKLEILPTGYMLVDGGSLTSVHYLSQTVPLPNDKPTLAVATALAGSFLGLQYLFMDAGSGAKNPVSQKLIKGVKNNTHCPLIVGGGIDSVDKAKKAWSAGADLVVMGNGVEKSPDLLTGALDYLHLYNLSLHVN